MEQSWLGEKRKNAKSKIDTIVMFWRTNNEGSKTERITETHLHLNPKLSAKTRIVNFN